MLMAESTLGQVDAAAVGSGRPVHSFPTYQGQRKGPRVHAGAALTKSTKMIEFLHAPDEEVRLKTKTSLAVRGDSIDL